MHSSFTKKINSLAPRLAFLLAVILFFLMVISAEAYDVVFAWDPNSESDLSGYVLYVDDGTSDLPYEYFDTYPLEEMDPDNPSMEITGLQDDQVYFFVLTAYNTEGIESDYSEEICVYNGQACSENIEDSNTSVSGEASNTSVSGNGGGGGGCFISTATLRTTTLRKPAATFALVFLFCIVMASLAGFRKK